MGSIFACRWSSEGAVVRLFWYEFDFCVVERVNLMSGWGGLISFLKSNERSEMCKRG